MKKNWLEMSLAAVLVFVVGAVIYVFRGDWSSRDHEINLAASARVRAVSSGLRKTGNYCDDPSQRVCRMGEENSCACMGLGLVGIQNCAKGCASWTVCECPTEQQIVDGIKRDAASSCASNSLDGKFAVVLQIVESPPKGVLLSAFGKKDMQPYGLLGQSKAGESSLVLPLASIGEIVMFSINPGLAPLDDKDFDAWTPLCFPMDCRVSVYACKGKSWVSAIDSNRVVQNDSEEASKCRTQSGPWNITEVWCLFDK
ncbi:MAG: hypothetical protein PHS79_00725 [Patescibacteria group bacterium]|nr:hypothetical protein [Patescibacteria group bacterium]